MGLLPPPKMGLFSSMWNDFFLRISDPSPGSSRSYQDESGWAPRSVSRGLRFLQMELLVSMSCSLRQQRDLL